MYNAIPAQQYTGVAPHHLSVEETPTENIPWELDRLRDLLCLLSRRWEELAGRLAPVTRDEPLPDRDYGCDGESLPRCALAHQLRALSVSVQRLIDAVDDTHRALQL